MKRIAVYILCAVCIAVLACGSLLLAGRLPDPSDVPGKPVSSQGEEPTPSHGEEPTPSHGEEPEPSHGEEPEPSHGEEKSGDTSLAALYVGENSIDLSEMTFSVPNETDEVTLTVVPTSDKATVEASERYALEVGDNTLIFTVVAENGDRAAYELTVTRRERVKSSEARLSSLALDGMELNGTFSSKTYTYTAKWKKSVTTVKVTAKPKDKNATVSVTGDGPVKAGNNVITVLVTAEDGKTQKKYTVSFSAWPVPYDGSYGLDITDKTDLVSICYSMWHDFTTTAGDFNGKTITQMEQEGSHWSSDGSTFYFWGIPEGGIYKSSDKKVIRRHMTQLADAGVDFIILDNTNADYGWKTAYVTSTQTMWMLMIYNPVNAILETCLDMRAEGLKTPYIVFWNRGESGDYWSVTNAVYDEYFLKERYRDLWVYWDGKPFFLLTCSDQKSSLAAAGKPSRDITVRKMWGLTVPKTSDEWSFLQTDNSVMKGPREQMCVCVAAQIDYMSRSPKSRNHGITFYEQWKNAFAVRPKIVTLTWWNEWGAQRQVDRYGKTQWVDAYNTECSRDIEPMQGGHGDRYYRWMIKYISAYKQHKACPRLVESGY